MKTIQTTIYKCDHCGKNYFKKHAAVNHETICKNNPDNFQPCLHGCKYLDREKVTIYYDTCRGEESFEADAFVCKKKDQLMYPLQAVKLNEKYDLEAHDQIQMPLISCSDFEHNMISKVDTIFDHW